MSQRLLQRPARGGEVVDAHVQQRAACARGVVEAVVGVKRQREAEAGLDAAQPADGAGVHPALDLCVGGQEARPHGFHQEEAPLACQCHQGLGLGTAGGQALLAEHAAAGTQGGVDGLGVLRVRRGHVDGVDVATRQPRGQVGAGVGHGFAGRRGFARKGLGTGGVAAADGDQFGFGQGVQRLGKRLGDAPRPHHGPADGAHGLALSARPVRGAATRGPRPSRA